jgi:hypothetical protein
MPLLCGDLKIGLSSGANLGAFFVPSDADGSALVLADQADPSTFLQINCQREGMRHRAAEDRGRVFRCGVPTPRQACMSREQLPPPWPTMRSFFGVAWVLCKLRQKGEHQDVGIAP